MSEDLTALAADAYVYGFAARAARGHEQLAAGPRRAVPAHLADIPAAGGRARRQLPAPAHHESESLTSA
jgi:hypothetical protein